MIYLRNMKDKILSALFMNEASQSSNSYNIIFSKKGSWKLPLTNLKLKVLSFIRVLKYFPFSKLFHSFTTRHNNQILKIIIVKASIYVSNVLFISTCYNTILSFSSVIFLWLSFFIFGMNVLYMT